ncbi:immunoglobulin-like domain-containing protein [Haloplasma contractile]|uniref:Ig-like domain protein n=1 Tax=Haloplasma contractile SSD-17B TaxID=1033810 RepID=F7Q0H3_9MOLU|nr:immunoglobulin-like domain-containing protein [Haloplasma contractile]ERJ12681.1 Ig-like domain protein [Haloplasma contractile SSD-17B]
MREILVIILVFMLTLLVGCQVEDEQSQNKETVQEQDAEILGANNITISLGDEFNPLEGVTAKDDTRNLTDELGVQGEVNTEVPGTYVLTYQVMGTNDKLVTESRTVIVESQSPIISVEEPKVTLFLGSDFDLLTGVTVEDDYDTYLKAIVKDDDGFNKDKVGTYIILYEVTDSEGHTSQSTRTITVEDADTVSK